MNVIFISQCQKKALKTTRRILDSFATRLGDNTWQTIITTEGLLAVKKLLAKSATKNTAVACHWCRSRSRNELLWRVGRKSAFNAQGHVPVHRTQMTQAQFESDWDFLPLIKAITGLAALLHDWGKATNAFQSKLQSNEKIAEYWRHEWVSCLLIYAYIAVVGGMKNDAIWLAHLSEGTFDSKAIYKQLQQLNSIKFSDLPQAAQCLIWLVLTHHRLPGLNYELAKNQRDLSATNLQELLKKVDATWGYQNGLDEAAKATLLSFSKGILADAPVWRKQLKKWSQKLQQALPALETAIENGSHYLLLQYARLCLMLGDHHYSSLECDPDWAIGTKLYANTGKDKCLKQHLDEHLVGVCKHAVGMAHALPNFESKLPVAEGIVRLKKTSPKGFEWQDKAAQAIRNYCHRTQKAQKKYGFFGVNMASTGKGKTLANAKILYNLSDDHNSFRFTLALNLCTLTLQTGQEYREKLGLDNLELAILIGSKPMKKLHDTQQDAQLVDADNDSEALHFGSESMESLLGDCLIDFDGALPMDKLANKLQRTKDKQMLMAPVLTCTIDHMMAAVETKRGGRYILPMLRLMSADLIIDEVDDFSDSDIIAIGRLIHWAGMLGRKVLLSSATIPPALAEGYFNAYQAGWKKFSQIRQRSPQVTCAWFDEFNAELRLIESSTALACYRKQHHRFIDKRVAKLRQQLAKRKAKIVPCPYDSKLDAGSALSLKTQYFTVIKQAVLAHHAQDNTLDPMNQCRVSFGVIRMANIVPCVALSDFLISTDWPDEVVVKVMSYHSNQTLLLRHLQEQHLDKVLKREKQVGATPKVFQDPVIQAQLAKHKGKQVIFMLVATPVEEVGRDHDFDWGIIEPSSYRSFIQLAGRILRHRQTSVDHCNVSILQYNLKAYKALANPTKKQACFINPGYEYRKNFRLATHNLFELVDEAELESALTAIPRIQKPEQSHPHNALITLEHTVLEEQLTNYAAFGPGTLQGYLDQAWQLTALPQILEPFRKQTNSISLFYVYKAPQDFVFCEKDKEGEPLEVQKKNGHQAKANGRTVCGTTVAVAGLLKCFNRP